MRIKCNSCNVTPGKRPHFFQPPWPPAVYIRRLKWPGFSLATNQTKSGWRRLPFCCSPGKREDLPLRPIPGIGCTNKERGGEREPWTGRCSLCVYKVLLRGRYDLQHQRKDSHGTYWTAWCMCPLHPLSRHSRQSLKSQTTSVSKKKESDTGGQSHARALVNVHPQSKAGCCVDNS